MAVVKKKKAGEKKKTQKEKKKPFQPIFSLKTTIWNLLFVLSFPPHFSKLGLSSEGGIWDFRA